MYTLLLEMLTKTLPGFHALKKGNKATGSPLLDFHDQTSRVYKLPAGSIGKQLLGDTMYLVLPADFLQLQNLMADPGPMDEFENGYLAKILPFILQRLKMWGLQTMSPDSLSRFIKELPDSSDINNNKPRKINFGSKPSTPESPISKSTTPNLKPISKLDLLASLYAFLHPLIFQDIMKLFCQFSMSLPLIMQDITQVNKTRYICLASLLETCCVKWEYIPGKVRFNEIFHSPFKMIVCVRVGSPASNQPGKSSILNQALFSRKMFSSFSDPGSQHGKPLTQDGSVEFCALTQETASSTFWQSIVQQHYVTGTEQVLLLANMHGDCLRFPETLALLKTFASKFIIFLNTMEKDEMEGKYAKVESIFDDEWNDNIDYILVDPTAECEDLIPDQVVYTAKLLSDATAQIVRNVVGNAVKGSDFGVGNQETVKVSKQKSYKTVQFAPDIVTPESQDLIDFIDNIGCQETKAALKLQKMSPKTDAYQNSVDKVWNESPVLRSVVTKFYTILKLPLNKRLIAMSHLDKNWSRITENSSAKLRDTIVDLKAEKIELISLTKSAESDNLRQLLEVKLETAFKELDQISLGIEHLYREAGRVFAYSQIFPSSWSENCAILPTNAAELLVHGHSIEILDGDILDLHSTWFNSVCHKICQKYGADMKIFVVSIIGLQSSGKSTLLNALFACKFAVSVGRCTRGLFMRILFLEKSLAEDLGVDAIIVLDTEGLGAPEMLMDKDCEQKDRLLATFTMSISNLTLINVLGESIRDLSDILQIVVVTLARLDEANISPDICMVQHLSERDSAKTLRCETEFGNALQEAVSLTETKDMNMGIRNSKSLQLLQERIKKGDLVKLFPPFRNGATVNAPLSENYQEAVTELYQYILDVIKSSKATQTFHSWHEIIQGYWAAVSKQDFALRFKNIREIQEFIERGSCIAACKSAVDEIFRKHRHDFQTELRATFNQFVSNRQKSSSEWEFATEELLRRMDEMLRKLPGGCPGPCAECAYFGNQEKKLYKIVDGKSFEQEVRDTISTHIQATRNHVIKNLRQLADALLVIHGKCAEVDEIIAQTIHDKLQVKSMYSNQEKNRFAKEIWLKVREISKGKMPVEPKPSVKPRIIREICEAYNSNESVGHEVEKQKLPDLSKEFATNEDCKNIWQKRRLKLNDLTTLLTSLNNVAPSILANYHDKYFQSGMISKLQEKIEEVLTVFEKTQVKTDLLPEFKWKVRVYGLIRFTRLMAKIEEDWNQLHNPWCILVQREGEYRKKIKIFLDHGFGFESEGQLIAEKLLEGIRQTAQTRAEQEHANFVCGQGWLSSSENVRLRYFLGLAKQIDSGNKKFALDHFRNPKVKISRWFKKQVDSLPIDQAIYEYGLTADTEFERMRKCIHRAETAEQLRDFVKNFLTSVEGVQYNPQPDLDFRNATDMEFKLYKDAALKKLEVGKSSLKENVSVKKASKNEKILKILGCTEHCYWCGALCWGEFEHDKNRDDTRKHHACHQVRGLKGTKDKVKKILTVNTCDSMDDEGWTVYWVGCEEGMKWGQAKSHQDFSGWMFTAHSQNLFSDLMKWFFVNLHEDIASWRGFEPVAKEKLKEQGFYSIANLGHIVSLIESRLGKM